MNEHHRKKNLAPGEQIKIRSLGQSMNMDENQWQWIKTDSFPGKDKVTSNGNTMKITTKWWTSMTTYEQHMNIDEIHRKKSSPQVDGFQNVFPWTPPILLYCLWGTATLVCLEDTTILSPSERILISFPLWTSSPPILPLGYCQIEIRCHNRLHMQSSINQILWGRRRMRQPVN